MKFLRRWQPSCYYVHSMRRLVWGCIAMYIVSVGPAFSQAEDHGDDLPTFRFSASVDAVHLNVSVVNKKGKLIHDLEQADFRLLEDDVVQEIVYFSRGTDSPVDVVMLVDASGSMEVTAKAANARNAAVQLIRGLKPEDRVAVYAFDRDLYRLTDFSQTKEEAVEALTRLEPFGSTALYDAVAMLSDHVIHEGFGRRAIVVVTDGVDTSSGSSVEAAVDKAKGVDLPVYAIRVLSPVDDPNSDLFLGVHGASFRGEDALRQFTEETGGAMYEGSQWGQLVVASARIREELKTQYRIGYIPQQDDGEGEFRRIRVETRRRGIEVRTRKGYYPKKSSGLSNTRPATTESSN